MAEENNQQDQQQQQQQPLMKARQTGDMRYTIIDNFLTDEECDHLISNAWTRLQAAEGWDVTEGKSSVSPYRTATQMFFQRGETPIIKRIEERIARTTGIPEENGEGIQVVKYEMGGHYYDHHDGFDPAYEGNQSVLARGGQRVMTVIMYLNDIAQDGGEGGATFFPMLNLRVYPKRGTALIWHNVDDDGRLDPNMLHAGEDLMTDKKSKVIATKWLRESEFH